MVRQVQKHLFATFGYNVVSDRSLRGTQAAAKAQAKKAGKDVGGDSHNYYVINNLKSLEKLCTEGRLPNLEPDTVAELQSRLATNFGESNVTVTPAEKGDSVEVEIVLPDRTITNRVKVLPPGAVDEEEVKVPYVPLPVVLPEDPELVWVLARREDLPPVEASRALAAIEEEFWETKLGLKLLKDRVEKNFFEFISRVPAGALADRGLKRMFKTPEPLHTLRRLVPNPQAELETLRGTGRNSGQ
jgi:hypothetical protein